MIIFLNIPDPATKIKRICDFVRHFYVNGERLMILAPNAEAAHYIDQLLWKIPEESFIPHAVTDEASQERVIITTKESNLNNASILLNLCPTIPSFYDTFPKVFDLFDKTHPEKERLSNLRLQDYQSKNENVKIQ